MKQNEKNHIKTLCVGGGKKNKRSKLSELMSIDFFNGRKKRMMDWWSTIPLHKNHSALPGKTSIKSPCAYNNIRQNTEIENNLKLLTVISSFMGVVFVHITPPPESSTAQQIVMRIWTSEKFKEILDFIFEALLLLYQYSLEFSSINLR